MAVYCTLQELTDRYGTPMLLQLSDRGETFPVAPDAALFDRAIADAGALIDGYLAGRYQLPLSPVPSLVVNLALVISIYMAHSSVAGDKIRKDYDDALKTLASIGKGDVTLDAAGVEPAGNDTNEVLTNDPSRPLSAETMKGYI